MNATTQMQQHALQQGDAAWLAHRMGCFNASDTAAMDGCSPYTTRSELLQRLHTGLTPEVDGATQRRYDDGHRTEALLRPLAEQLVGEDLYPIVGTRQWPGIERPLGASFDGLTIARDTGFECKRINDALREALPNEGPDGNEQAALPRHYRLQVEQQFMVCPTLERVLFGAAEFDADGNPTDVRWCWCTPDAALRAEIVRGWAQFEQDLSAYVPAEPATPAAVAAPVESLPAVLVEMRGSLAVHSNLDAFGAALRAFIERIPASPSSDQEFADCEAACKALKRAEEALEAEDERALNGMADVAAVRRVMSDLRELARTTRLQREKLVKARKEQLRTEQVQRGRAALAQHLQALNQRLGGGFMPDVPADFAGCISGLKSLDSIRDRIDTELARAKIAANEIADRVQANLKAIDAAGAPGLFPDRGVLALKAVEDCAAAIQARLATERERQEKERERIRQEEAARLEREQAAAREAEIRKQHEADESPATTAPAPAPSVVQMPARAAAPAAPSGPPTLKLGDINARLGFALTADFLASLGFVPAATDKSAKLFHEAQFIAICNSLIGRIAAVRDQRAAA